MLMMTWLVSGHTWGDDKVWGGMTKCVGVRVSWRGRGGGGAVSHPCPHLEDDDVVVAEGAELAGPGGVVTDHLVNDVFEVQRQLLHRQVLPLGGGEAPVTPLQCCTGWG